MLGNRLREPDSQEPGLFREIRTHKPFLEEPESVTLFLEGADEKETGSPILALTKSNRPVKVPNCVLRSETTQIKNKIPKSFV